MERHKSSEDGGWFNNATREQCIICGLAPRRGFKLKGGGKWGEGDRYMAGANTPQKPKGSPKAKAQAKTPVERVADVKIEKLEADLAAEKEKSAAAVGVDEPEAALRARARTALGLACMVQPPLGGSDSLLGDAGGQRSRHSQQMQQARQAGDPVLTN